MAGKCKEMNKIKQALRLHQDGESNRSIGRKLNLYKGTVNKYISMAEASGIPIPVLLEKEEPELERILTGGNPAYSDNRFEDLKERLPYIVSELEKRHITMYLLWREYRALMPGGYGYTQFCFHVNQYTHLFPLGLALAVWYVALADVFHYVLNGFLDAAWHAGESLAV